MFSLRSDALTRSQPKRFTANAGSGRGTRMPRSRAAVRPASAEALLLSLTSDCSISLFPSIGCAGHLCVGALHNPLPAVANKCRAAPGRPGKKDRHGGSRGVTLRVLV